MTKTTNTTLLTNESNPAALKILTSAKFGQKSIQIKLIDIKDVKSEPKRLPILQLATGEELFISNASARYLFPPKSTVEASNDEWLEWESVILRPVIVNLLSQTKINDTLKSSLLVILKQLDKCTSKFLTGNEISVCDIAIWSNLHPIFLSNELKSEYLSPFNNIVSWINNVEALEEVKLILNEYVMISGLKSYASFAVGEHYLSNAVSSVESGANSPTEDDSVTPDELIAAKQAWSRKYNSKPKPIVNPVLPVPGEKNVLITSALPYVNNVPHLGNIIGCVLSADVFARFCRLCRYNALYICGTDEYGTATETKALEEKLTPQQICDKYFQIHNTIYRWFGIGFDYFGRTTTPEQTVLVQELFLKLNGNGFIETQPVDQLLCEKCQRYLADRFVEGGCPHPGCGYEDARGDQCDGCSRLINATELIAPRCKVCRSTPIMKTSHQFFLDLPKLEPLLRHWMEKSSPGWTNNAKVIGKSWLKEGLKPRCITRDLKWGIPVPLDGYRDKVFYVWFDAPIGYMSITKRYTKEWEKWWKPSKNTSISLYNFMAKDNVPFHSVMFPAVLLGINEGYQIVNHIMATEYLNYEDGKFSKSRSVGVFGTDALETGIPCDVWRFYLLYVRPENQDSSFNWTDLATKNNSELLNNLGNFINRALMFAEKFFNSLIPNMIPTEVDYNLLALCTRELKGYMSCLEKGRLRDGIRHILTISRHGNQYMQSSQPWVLVKGDEVSKTRAGTVIGICANLVCLLANLLHPYMPETSRIIRNQLKSSEDLMVLNPENSEIMILLPPGHQIGKPVPLFQKIEETTIDELKGKYGGKQTVKTDELSLSVAELEAAITKQGDKVRILKSSGVDKKMWQPEVDILLNLKKKLAVVSGASPAVSKPAKQTKQNQKESTTKSKINQDPLTPKQNPGAVADSVEIKKLEAEIEKQGTLVRQMKTEGKLRTEWQPAVNMLLELKNKLVALTGTPVAKGKSK